MTIQAHLVFIESQLHLLLIFSFCNYIPTLNVKKGVLYGRPTNFSWGLTPYF